MSSENLERALFEFLRRPEYRPIKPKLIAKHLHLPEERVHDLKRLIKKLVKRGVVAYGPNHLVMGLAGPAAKATEAPASDDASTADTAGTAAPVKPGSANRITGVFRRAAGGFGFVRPANAGVAHTREQ